MFLNYVICVFTLTSARSNVLHGLIKLRAFTSLKVASLFFELLIKRERAQNETTKHLGGRSI